MLQSTALRYSSQREQTGNQQPPAAKRGGSHIQKAVAKCADPFVPLRPLKIWENLRFLHKKVLRCSTNTSNVFLWRRRLGRRFSVLDYAAQRLSVTTKQGHKFPVETIIQGEVNRFCNPTSNVKLARPLN